MTGMPAFNATRTLPRKAGFTSQNCDASGYVVVTHGGTTIPVSIQVSGRNTAHEPVITGLDATTFTVRFQSRTTAIPLSSAVLCAFDWGCDF